VDVEGLIEPDDELMVKPVGAENTPPELPVRFTFTLPTFGQNGEPV
jgi:hypothetical protein